MFWKRGFQGMSRYSCFKMLQIWPNYLTILKISSTHLSGNITDFGSKFQLHCERFLHVGLNRTKKKKTITGSYPRNKSCRKPAAVCILIIRMFAVLELSYYKALFSQCPKALSLSFFFFVPFTTLRWGHLVQVFIASHYALSYSGLRLFISLFPLNEMLIDWCLSIVTGGHHWSTRKDKGLSRSTVHLWV